jgi:hypothetical protein
VGRVLAMTRYLPPPWDALIPEWEGVADRVAGNPKLLVEVNIARVEWVSMTGLIGYKPGARTWDVMLEWDAFGRHSMQRWSLSSEADAAELVRRIIDNYPNVLSLKIPRLKDGALLLIGNDAKGHVIRRQRWRGYARDDGPGDLFAAR